MKNRPHPTTPTRASKSSTSPVKAQQLATPPFKDYVTYGYTQESTRGKTLVLTPGETHQYPVPDHTGMNHNYMRSPAGTEYEEGDFYPTFPRSPG